MCAVRGRPEGMGEARLNWMTAAVKDGRLTVELDGDVPTGWKKSFHATVRLLGGGDWGKTEYKKRVVQVGRVQPGDEEKLRHFLESAVAQANAATAPSEPAPDADEQQATPADDAGPDAAMTEQFRSFSER